MQEAQRRGFTLIELSIVLVIIGLIVGGVLVGQDLIHAAEVRATISQIEKYNAAVNTFRDKYGGLPGDLNASSATQFGFVARAGTVGRGDGNGLIEACGTASTAFACETEMFWTDLSSAQLVDGSFTRGADMLANAGAAISSAFDQWMPLAKLGRGNYITVFAYQGQNFYEITGITSISAVANYTLTSALNPNESYAIDKKVDDGYPTTGNVRGWDWVSMLNGGGQGSGTNIAPNTAATAPTNSPVAGTGPCVAATVTLYNNAGSAANSPGCQLSLRFQ